MSKTRSLKGYGYAQLVAHFTRLVGSSHATMTPSPALFGELPSLMIGSHDEAMRRRLRAAPRIPEVSPIIDLNWLCDLPRVLG